MWTALIIGILVVAASLLLLQGAMTDEDAMRARYGRRKNGHPLGCDCGDCARLDVEWLGKRRRKRR